jgi:YD repeat-containing protein
VKKDKTFHIAINQIVKLDANIIVNPGVFDSTHNWGIVGIKNVATGEIVFSTSTPEVKTIYLPAGDYELELTAKGAVITAMGILNFTSGVNPSNSTEKITGGCRVEKIITGNAGEVPMIKKYYYGTMDDLEHSSLIMGPEPRYDGYNANTMSCGSGMLTCEYTTLNSSSVFNMGLYNNNLVSYNSVVESIGENFEGGGTESKFYTTPDAMASTVFNKDISNAPYSNTASKLNARPLSETVIKKMRDGTLKAIKKTTYEYNDDPVGESRVYGYTVVQRVSDNLNGSYGFDTTCYTAPCYEMLEIAVDFYDIAKYTFFSSWVYPSKQIETVYDENGANPLTIITNTHYSNINHCQLTSSDVTNSKEKTILTTNFYPHDFEGTAVYDDMIANHIFSPVISSKTEIVNLSGSKTIVSEQRVNYANTINSHQLPASIEKSVKGNGLEIEGTIDLYDNNGNILQHTTKAGIVTTIIWGYNYEYPVAQVIGASYSNVIAQLTGGTVAALQGMDGVSLRTELNKIRTGLPKASVTSYTYHHLIGVNSITDPNNKTTTYEYDSFNRLMIVRDQDGMVVKKNEYVYTSPNANADFNVYSNQSLTQYFNCTTCLPGFSSSSTSYTVPAGRYYSLISPADAASKAVADMALNGQDYVNKKALCFNTTCVSCNTTTCGGIGQKCIQGACENGTRVNTSMVYNTTTHMWTCTYHFEWIDSTQSPNYSEVSANGCPEL